MERISIKGVLWGIAVDYLGPLIIFLLTMLIFGKEILYANVTNDFLNVLLIAMVVFRIFFAILGGYIASRIAKRSFYLNSGLVGGFEVLAHTAAMGIFPLWFNVISFTVAVPAAMYGGHIALNQKHKQA